MARRRNNPEPGPGSASGRTARWATRIGLAAAALALIYAVGMASLGALGFDKTPSTVLRLHPWHGPSLARAAVETVSVGGDADALERSVDLARRAVRQSPVTPEAFGVLALAAERSGDREAAGNLMRAANGLSRREEVVHFWLIEEAIRNDDAVAALSHYDMALKTSREAETLLVPNLVASLREEWIVPYLAQMLGSEPVWSDPFRDLLVIADVPNGNKVRLIELLSQAEPFGETYRQKVASQLVGEGDYALAARLLSRPFDYDERLARAFTLPATGLPFEWKLNEGAGAFVGFEERDDRMVLAGDIGSDVDDAAARILLTLPAGQWRIDFGGTTLSDSRANANWTLRCARSNATIVEEDTAPEASSATFTVPNDAACSAQWLALTVAPPLSGEPATQFVSQGVSIRR